MAVTLGENGAPRPKATGRPMDAAVAQFELALEGVLALEDDATALEHIFAGLRHIRTCVVKLEDEAEARIRRIRGHVQPEIKRLVELSDNRLTLATIERAARRAQDRALTAVKGAK